ncbi:MAG: hypothetical protein AB7F86_05585 [Bdellovibrionales bacterium]
MRVVLGLLVLVSLAGCDVKKKKEKYSYNLTENGCSTGTKEFSSKDAMCAALKNDAANVCADGSPYFVGRGMRKQKFEADGCPGPFQP